MKTKTMQYIGVAAGLLLLAVGLYLVRTLAGPQGFLRALPYVCIGAGCGLFGGCLGSLIGDRAVQSDPELARRVRIEQNDERNIAVANSAKGKAFDCMTYVYSALMVSFALMGIDLVAVLLLVFAYLLVHGVALYYRIKFDREM